MTYGMPYQPRKAASQVWSIGEQVKVGFLSLRIVGRAADGSWQLVNRDASKRYEFTPHQGLQAVYAFN